MTYKSTYSSVSQAARPAPARIANGTVTPTQSIHNTLQGTEIEDRQQTAWVLAALRRRTRKFGYPSVINKLLQGPHQHAKNQPQLVASRTHSHAHVQRLQETENQTSTAAASHIPGAIGAAAEQLGTMLITPNKTSVARTKLKTKVIKPKQSSVAHAQRELSAQVVAQLQNRLHSILEDAASRPHWQADTHGFLACLNEVKLVFQQIFSPANPQQKPEHCCSVKPTADTLGQCLDSIMPMLLLPQQAPAQNTAQVAEFLQDIMGMNGAQVFQCFVEEPSVLYLDVYSDLMPLQDYFQTLYWTPADYLHIIVKHPQILLLPLQQYQRNIGYLLGQGLTRAEVLRMWGQRAGLLIEPLKAVHGEVLGLRAAGRPLQDLALPAHLRMAPLPETSRDHLNPFATKQHLPSPSDNSDVKHAISALVGTPQAVYLYKRNDVFGKYKGVTQKLDVEFTAKAPVGRKGAWVKLGVYQTKLAAAQAYDAAMHNHFGEAASLKLNFPADYANMHEKVLHS